MLLTSQPILLLPRILLGHEHDDLPVTRRKAVKYQDTVRGDLIPGMGDGKDSPEIVGPHYLDKTSGADVSCQIQRDPKNGPGSLGASLPPTNWSD